MCEYCKIPGKTLAVIEAEDPRCPMCGRNLEEEK